MSSKSFKAFSVNLLSFNLPSTRLILSQSNYCINLKCNNNFQTLKTLQESQIKKSFSVTPKFALKSAVRKQNREKVVHLIAY